MRALKYDDVRKGNVVRFNGSLYIVAETRQASLKDDKLEAVTLISFTHSDVTVYVSASKPATTRVYDPGCLSNDCGHNVEIDDQGKPTYHARLELCPYVREPDPKQSIDSIKVEAKSVEDFIMNGFRKLFNFSQSLMGW